MVKCKVIKQFKLKEFSKLQNIKRKSIDRKGELFEGDTFECSKKMAKYLLGDNKEKVKVVKILEVKP